MPEEDVPRSYLFAAQTSCYLAKAWQFGIWGDL
jgi:hypothetical protein